MTIQKQKKEAKLNCYLLESIRPGTRRQHPRETLVPMSHVKGFSPGVPGWGCRDPGGYRGEAEMEPGKGEEKSKQNSRHLLSSCHLEPSRAQGGREDRRALPPGCCSPGGNRASVSSCPTPVSTPAEPPTGSDLWSLTRATTTGHPLPAQGVLQWENSHTNPHQTERWLVSPIPYGQCHAEQRFGSPTPFLGFPFP